MLSQTARPNPTSPFCQAHFEKKGLKAPQAPLLPAGACRGARAIQPDSQSAARKAAWAAGYFKSRSFITLYNIEV